MDLQAWLEQRGQAEADGIYCLGGVSRLQAGAEQYHALREQEERIYPDTVLRKLPDIDPGNRYYREWRIRKNTFHRLARYIAAKERATRILDVGCGNGWLSNCLARIAGVEVFALDTNRPELEQAARVFADNEDLRFMCGDIFRDILPAGAFDMAVMGASIQYFPHPGEAVSRLLTFLREGGELHIVDSPFYSERNRTAARERSRAHFERLGHPEMLANYHHHRLSDLDPFSPALVYNPRALHQRVLRRTVCRDRSPFPWIRIMRGAARVPAGSDRPGTGAEA